MIDFTPLQRIIIFNNERKTDADDLFKLYIHNSQTLYIYLHISCICSVHARHFSFFLSFFASLKLNVVFHFVHSASSASLSLPRRAFHPVPPLETPSPNRPSVHSAVSSCAISYALFCMSGDLGIQA